MDKGEKTRWQAGGTLNLRVTKKDRKYFYPLVLFVPVILTIVFVLNSVNGTEEDTPLKWIILGVIWLIAIGIILEVEREIRTKKKRK